MNTTLRRDADEIICSSIQAVLPDKAVCRALENFQPGGGRVLLVAAGKAAWQMAHAAVQALGRVDGGVVVEEGPAKQLIDHPREQRTKQFLAHYAE
jgi:glycerate 2-kinase